MLGNFIEKNIDGIIEVLLSLKVNALQISPELGKNLVYELVRNDIFNIEKNNSYEFLISILELNNNSIKYALNVISSTLRGVEYLVSKNKMPVIERVIKVFRLLCLSKLNIMDR